MSSEITVALLAIAATLTVAAVAAFWKILSFTLRLDELQTKYRHDLRNDAQAMINRVEDHLGSRVHELEMHSAGWQQWQRRKRSNIDE